MSCRFALAATLFAVSACGFSFNRAPPPSLGDVEHIIVIYLENHSFDNLFGFFPDADGIATAGATKIQVDADGKPLCLPAACRDDLPTRKTTATQGIRNRSDRFPDNPAEPTFQHRRLRSDWRCDGRSDPSLLSPEAQIDGGRMDKFVAYTNVGALVMGFYDGSRTKLWNYAKRYTLADHFFQAAFGGSFLNHFWMICACTPRYEAYAPERAQRRAHRRQQPVSSCKAYPTRSPLTVTP